MSQHHVHAVFRAARQHVLERARLVILELVEEEEHVRALVGGSGHARQLRLCHEHPAQEVLPQFADVAQIRDEHHLSVEYLAEVDPTLLGAQDVRHRRVIDELRQPGGQTHRGAIDIATVRAVLFVRDPVSPGQRVRHRVDDPPAILRVVEEVPHVAKRDRRVVFGERKEMAHRPREQFPHPGRRRHQRDGDLVEDRHQVVYEFLVVVMLGEPHQVHRHRMLAIAGVEVDRALDAFRRNAARDLLGERSLWVDQEHALPRADERLDHVAHERRLAHPRRTREEHVLVEQAGRHSHLIPMVVVRVLADQDALGRVDQTARRAYLLDLYARELVREQRLRRQVRQRDHLVRVEQHPRPARHPQRDTFRDEVGVVHRVGQRHELVMLDVELAQIRREPR